MDRQASEEGQKARRPKLYEGNMKKKNVCAQAYLKMSLKVSKQIIIKEYAGHSTSASGTMQKQ